MLRMKLEAGGVGKCVAGLSFKSVSRIIIMRQAIYYSGNELSREIRAGLPVAALRFRLAECHDVIRLQPDPDFFTYRMIMMAGDQG